MRMVSNLPFYSWIGFVRGKDLYFERIIMQDFVCIVQDKTYFMHVIENSGAGVSFSIFWRGGRLWKMVCRRISVLRKASKLSL